MVRSSIDTGGALHQDSILDASKESTRSQIKFMIIIKPQDHPEYRTIILLLNSYQLSMAKHYKISITKHGDKDKY